MKNFFKYLWSLRTVTRRRHSSVVQSLFGIGMYECGDGAQIEKARIAFQKKLDRSLNLRAKLLERKDASILRIKALAAAELHNMSLRRAEEIKNIEVVVGEIVRKASVVNWDRRPEGYFAVTLQFDPRLWGRGADNKSELEYLARYMGHQIEREIASMHFLKSARDLEMERMQAGRQSPYFRDPL